MKRTAVFSGFIALAMMFTLGLSSPINQNKYGVLFTAPYLMTMDHQLFEGLILVEELTVVQPGNGTERARPDRFGIENRQPRKRGSLDASRPIHENFVEHVMLIAREIDPELADQLKSICETNPEALERIIRGVGRNRFRNLVRLRDSDPELFAVKVSELKMDAEIYRFTEQFHKQETDPASVPAKIAQLRGLVGSKTKLSIRAQEIYISRLERHLDGLRMKMKKTTEHFDEIVDRRVRQLTQIHLDVTKSDKLLTD